MPFGKFSLFFLFGVLFSTTVFSQDDECKSIEVPIVFDQYGLPTIELIIDGNSNLALLDLGSTAGLHLPISDVASIPNVKYTGKSVKSINLSGEIFSAKEFIIPMFTVRCLAFENITGYELNPWATSIGDKPEGLEEEQQIVIGQGFFLDKTISINYANKTLVIKSKPETVLPKNKFMPYVLNEEGITIPMRSAIANYQMVLDTGATSSIFAANKVNIKEPLTVCDLNLGPGITCNLFTAEVGIAGYPFLPNILLYPIDPQFTQDGLLGGDFFNNFIVELDFSAKSIALTPLAPGVL